MAFDSLEEQAPGPLGLRARTASLPLPRGWASLRHGKRTLFIKYVFGLASWDG